MVFTFLYLLQGSQHNCSWALWSTEIVPILLSYFSDICVNCTWSKRVLPRGSLFNAYLFFLFLMVKDFPMGRCQMCSLEGQICMTHFFFFMSSFIIYQYAYFTTEPNIKWGMFQCTGICFRLSRQEMKLHTVLYEQGRVSLLTHSPDKPECSSYDNPMDKELECHVLAGSCEYKCHISYLPGKINIYINIISNIYKKNIILYIIIIQKKKILLKSIQKLDLYMYQALLHLYLCSQCPQ